MNTSGPHGQRAEECINRSWDQEITSAGKQMWLHQGLVHALLSISGQLGELLDYLHGDGGQADETAIPERHAEPLVTCGMAHPDHPNLKCTWPADHLFQGVTDHANPQLGETWPGPDVRDPSKLTQVQRDPMCGDVQGNGCVLLPGHDGKCIPSNLLGVVAPVTGPMPAVIP